MIDDIKKIAEMVKYVGWLAFNINYEDFKSLLSKMVGPATDEYVDRMFASMRSDAFRWFMNLNEDGQAKFVEAALQKYSK